MQSQILILFYMKLENINAVETIRLKFSSFFIVRYHRHYDGYYDRYFSGLSI